jgi:hypothetical protein
MIDSTSSDVSLDPGPARPDPLALDDPHGALRSALDGGLDPTIPPEDIVLGWLLRLPATLDPAGAAARVIAVSALPVRNDRLLALLTDVANWPHHRLARLRGPGRSRPQ